MDSSSSRTTIYTPSPQLLGPVWKGGLRDGKGTIKVAVIGNSSL
jgi:hypothetical protein